MDPSLFGLSLETSSTAYQLLAFQEAEEKADLHKLVDTLDAKEVKIATQYVANLLLAGAKAANERTGG